MRIMRAKEARQSVHGVPFFKKGLTRNAFSRNSSDTVLPDEA